MGIFEKVKRRVFLGTTVGVPLALAGCVAGEKRTQGQQTQKTRLVDTPEVKRDFSRDGRSMKVVFVPHCAFNMNARHVDCADFPAMMEPLLEALRRQQVGIIQIPCPELRALGLGRDRDVPPLETIREGMELPEAQARLEPIIKNIIYIIKEYQFQGFHIVGILGKNGSPSCGVETTHAGGQLVEGEGVFIRLLRKALAQENLDIAIKGVDDHRQEEAIEWALDRI